MARMNKAIALARRYEAQSLETLRVALVSGCAIALIAAGQVLPAL